MAVIHIKIDGVHGIAGRRLLGVYPVVVGKRGLSCTEQRLAEWTSSPNCSPVCHVEGMG